MVPIPESENIIVSIQHQIISTIRSSETKMNNVNNEDWDTVDIDCICQYQGIRKGYCKKSYTGKCYECINNKLLTGKTENHYEIYL